MLKTLLQCMGFASLVLLPNYADLLGNGSNVRLHVPVALTGICMAQIADIVLLSVALFVLLALLQQTRLYPVVQLLIAMLAPSFLIWRTRSLLPFDLPRGPLAAISLAWISALLLMQMRRSSPWYGQTLRFAGALGVSFALFGIFNILQLLWVANWKPAPQEHHASWETTIQPARQHPLLVWIVFDELSYDQLFEHRAHDLELPYFDELRRQSIVFTDVQPAGYKTAKIIPSLLSGQQIDDLRYDMRNRLLVHAKGIPGFHRLAGSGTVFADAQRSGWRTAAVGWYNPYCGTYGDAIDECYWTIWDKLEGPMAQRESLWNNTVAPLQQLARKSLGPHKADYDLCSYDVVHRYQTHLDLEQHTVELLRADQADFVFLHLPIPHSPNIWSRMNDDYTQHCDSSYLDGLALADRELGLILGLLKNSPRWTDTTLIVEGDHGWRTDLWRDGPAWTEEDDAASRGVFDTRPALLIHRPGQSQTQTNTTAWPLMRIHDVVDEMLRGEAVHY